MHLPIVATQQIHVGAQNEPIPGEWLGKVSEVIH